MQKIERLKFLLLAVIVLTAAFPPFFVTLNEPTSALNSYKLLAKIGSLSGTILLLWQLLLGFRGLIYHIIPDLIWTINVHKNIGRFVLFLFLLHPVFITLYYLNKFGINLLTEPNYSWFYLTVLLGKIALVLLLSIVITSIIPAIRRHWAWYPVHVTSYIFVPLAFFHSFQIGSTIRESHLGIIWQVIAVMIGFYYLYRISHRLGLFIYKYRVTAAKKVASQVTKITMRPLQKQLVPRTGQFIYLRWGLLKSARPFTVSGYDHNSGELSVTVKALGKTTTNLQTIVPGELVYIDGPYGVFTRAALESKRPLVMIAGGIGITPFTRLFDELAYEPGREIHLFYGNKYKEEIIYKEEVENRSHVQVIHVLSDEPQHIGEKGFITVPLLQKYLNRPLNEYEYLICGPPVMIKKLETALLHENISANQIHHELFGF